MHEKFTLMYKCGEMPMHDLWNSFRRYWCRCLYRLFISIGDRDKYCMCLPLWFVLKLSSNAQALCLFAAAFSLLPSRCCLRLPRASADAHLFTEHCNMWLLSAICGVRVCYCASSATCECVCAVRSAQNSLVGQNAMSEWF